jgi:hypothetical protein
VPVVPLGVLIFCALPLAYVTVFGTAFAFNVPGVNRAPLSVNDDPAAFVQVDPVALPVNAAQVTEPVSVTVVVPEIAIVPVNVKLAVERMLRAVLIVKAPVLLLSTPVPPIVPDPLIVWVPVPLITPLSVIAPLNVIVPARVQSTAPLPTVVVPVTGIVKLDPVASSVPEFTARFPAIVMLAPSDTVVGLMIVR